MANSTTEVANLALSHLGVGTRITALTERSQEAQACAQFFDACVRAVLRDFSWPFATKIIDLVQVESDPNVEWSYSYRYPSDCVKFVRVLSGVRNDTRQTRVPTRVVQDDDTTGKLLLCDRVDAQGEYVYYVSQIERWPDDFVLAVSFRLAAYIAPLITGADPFKMRPQAMQLYGLEVGRAEANAANEEQVEDLPDTEMINARN